jgi:acyl carrier protein
MTDADLLDLLRRALHEVDPERADDWAELTLDRTIASLGLDSIKTMEMVGFVEDETDVTFDDEELADVETLAQLVALVRRG